MGFNVTRVIGARVWLLAALGLTTSAVVCFFVASNLMGAAAQQCLVGGNIPDCRSFGPWIWVTLVASLAAVGCLLAPFIGYVRRRASTHRRRSVLIAGASILLLIGAGGAYIGLQQRPDGAGTTAAKAAHKTGTETPSFTWEKKALDPVESTAARLDAQQPRNPFPEIPTTRVGLPLSGDPFVAESVEEQRWLDRNGYPNASQWNAFLNASDALLNEAAAAGNVSAKALLDQRRLLRGDEDALGSMLELGAEGSTFALELLSSTLASRREDRVMAYALSRVAEMRGNYRLAPGRDMMFGASGLSGPERLEAEGEALILYNNMLRFQRSSRGSRSEAIDPRPLGP